MLPPPPPPGDVNNLKTSDSLQVVHIASLTAALAKLNVNIPIEDLIKVMHDEYEAKRVKVTAEATQRRAAVSRLALQPTEATAGLESMTVSEFVPKPTKPLMSIRWRRNVVVVSSNLPNSPSPTARFQIRSH